jgi:hypothetical protein
MQGINGISMDDARAFVSGMVANAKLAGGEVTFNPDVSHALPSGVPTRKVTSNCLPQTVYLKMQVTSNLCICSARATASLLIDILLTRVPLPPPGFILASTPEPSSPEITQNSQP